MGQVIKAHISPCPECGENDWWMEVDTGKEVSEEEALRRAVTRRIFDEAREIRRDRGLFGYFRRRLEPTPVDYEDPSSPEHIRCANCGHEMSLGQGGNAANPKHGWPIT